MVLDHPLQKSLARKLKVSSVNLDDKTGKLEASVNVYTFWGIPCARIKKHFFIRVDLDEMNKIIEQRQILRTLPVNEFLTASLDVNTSYRSVGMENGRLVMENGSAASIAVTAVLANGANRAWVMKNSPGSERSLIMTSLALIETAV